MRVRFDGDIELDQPQTDAGQPETSQQQPDGRWCFQKLKFWKFLINIFTLVAVVWYAHEATVANDLTKEHTHIELRPYVSVGKNHVGESAEWILDGKGNRSGIRVFFENAGSTPAQRFYVNGGTGLKIPEHHLEMTPYPFVVPDTEHPGKTRVMGYSWIEGTTVPAHETVAVNLPNLSADNIRIGLQSATGILVFRQLRVSERL